MTSCYTIQHLLCHVTLCYIIQEPGRVCTQDWINTQAWRYPRRGTVEERDWNVNCEGDLFLRPWRRQSDLLKVPSYRISLEFPHLPYIETRQDAECLVQAWSYAGYRLIYGDIVLNLLYLSLTHYLDWNTDLVDVLTSGGRLIQL
jgi:hypothetical protein